MNHKRGARARLWSSRGTKKWNLLLKVFLKTSSGPFPSPAEVFGEAEVVFIFSRVEGTVRIWPVEGPPSPAGCSWLCSHPRLTVLAPGIALFLGKPEVRMSPGAVSKRGRLSSGSQSAWFVVWKCRSFMGKENAAELALPPPRGHQGRSHSHN